MPPLELDEKYPLLFQSMIYYQLISRILYFGFLALLIIVFFWDRYQKQHTILRNYPIIGHFQHPILMNLKTGTLYQHLKKLN